MKFQRVKCKSLSYAKEIFVSNSYIITCTGKKANILDKQFNLLQAIEGLDYVYSADMSPDEKVLLLISNENKFYVVNLETGNKRKVVVKPPYNYNIEGNGCWSFDGKYIYVIVMNSKNLLSTIRRYNVDNLDIYEDFLVEKYVLHKISKIYFDRTYLLLGYNRVNEMSYIFFFDGDSCKEYLLENTKNYPIHDIDLIEDYLLAYTGEKCRIYSLEGKLLGTLDLENIKVDDGITKIADSKNGDFKFISSNSGFYVIDRKTGNYIIEHQEEYGVQNFIEFEDGLIAINAFCNVKLYRLSGED